MFKVWLFLQEEGSRPSSLLRGDRDQVQEPVQDRNRNQNRDQDGDQVQDQDEGGATLFITCAVQHALLFFCGTPAPLMLTLTPTLERRRLKTDV